MKRLIFLFLYTCVFQRALAQESTKNFDLILTIDEIIVKTLYKPEIIIKQGEKTLKPISVKYHPGSLSFNIEEYKSLLLDYQKEFSIILKFDHYEYSSNGKQEIYNYEAEIGRNWFEESYVILRIYNTSKKKYRKILDSIKGKNYTYELETSRGQMIRIRKKK